jgi:small conductance mechanosensitive channel
LERLIGVFYEVLIDPDFVWRKTAMALWDDIQPYIVYIEAAVLVAVAVILERLIARYLKRVSKRKDWPPHVTNGLVLIFRLLILLGVVAMVLRIGGVPPDWLVAYSALGGAALGFASQRTLGNFLAGIFVFVTHPFRVNDYVKIDNIEGVVDEITFNYTKILTRSGTLVFISNLKVLDQNVVNYRFRGGKSRLYCYTVDLAFDHSLPLNQLEKAFDEVIERYEKKLPRKPEYVQLRLGAFDRGYVFYLYVKAPQDIFTVHPAFVKEITEAWEKAKEK